MLPNQPQLQRLAQRFAIPGTVTSVAPLGNGNVNDTYLVETSAAQRFVLQRLNTAVFRQPELVMANIVALNRHMARRAGAGAAGAERQDRPWQLPEAIPLRQAEPPEPQAGGGSHHLTEPSGSWRLLSYVEGATTHDTVLDLAHAAEVGRALGRFHAQIHDLPCEQLADTLEGFHITPAYLSHYTAVCRQALAERSAAGLDRAEQECVAFVEQRQGQAAVLEEAKAAGLLQLRPIHGDPKVNNVMLDAANGRAVALVDLDTVKPGLVHYDIGDCLRSGCNPAGEETSDLQAVVFDLERCGAMLGGYLEQARAFLTPADFDHLYAAMRLISFELGLRFFTDHLAGDRYFKVTHRGHNLQRARVQFRLTESIEAQEAEIRALVEALR